MTQVNYYNSFGKEYEESILSCPEPALWTTDYREQGRVYREMKERIEQQQALIQEYFNKDIPVLDIGCGFGRQAILLAKQGFSVTGTDTSDVFIGIAKKLFEHRGYAGNFICADILNDIFPSAVYRQVILFDVLEHLPSSRRRPMFEKIFSLSSPGAILLMSLPHVKERLSSRLNNSIRKRITQHFSWFLKREEHPYPIPGKRSIITLAKGLFSLDRFVSSRETDYYVFRRQ